MSKTRYLQLTDTAMFEYNMLGEGDNSVFMADSVIYTKCMDGHTAILSPVECECEAYVDDDGSTRYKKRMNPESLNTLNHFSVPMDSNGSEWYHFVDPDYRYVDDTIMHSLSSSQIKVRNFDRYLSNPISEFTPPLGSIYSMSGVRMDSARLYFVNGYDFSNIYGMMLRLSVKQTLPDGSEGDLDLCDFLVTRDNAYMLMKYLPSPILMSNDVYDRYVEIGIPCLYDLIHLRSEAIHSPVLDTLNIKDNTSIRLSFSVILENNISLTEAEFDITEQMSDDGRSASEKLNLSYTKTVNVKGAISMANVSSDNIGCYIAEVPNRPYIKFYATWKDEPLTKEIVWRFNKGIRLYDMSLVRRNSAYEVDGSYEVEHSERKWMAMHEIKLSFCMGSVVVKEETYSMNQIFISDTDPVEFYYRPLIFDDMQGHYIDNIQIVYTMRFVNANDKVQFLKVASLALLGNMGKYYAMGTSLSMSDLSPYKVYNRIEESNGAGAVAYSGIHNTKYVKSFYDSTSVVMDNGVSTYGSYEYVLKMSMAPKSYKFTFKNLKTDGRYAFMDLSDGYYKLMFKDDSGANVFVEPTYSDNMNMYLGELEFNISSGNIAKLTQVEDTERKMSIVSYNEDGSVSSMFDFLYII